ncbi:MAG TPA: hypothetical protein PLF40_18805 [Kofleriaceae bacterium]|nr:hypothetical protein [Kofleriaceae bacterium]
MARTYSILIGLLLIAGCSDNTNNAPKDAPLADAGADAAAMIIDTMSVYLDDCHAFSSRCEGENAADPRCGACQYRVRYRGDMCTAAAPCNDLFLYWSAFDCDTEALLNVTNDLLMTHPRTVVLCAQPNYPGEILPTSLGAPERDQRVVTAAMTRLRPGGDIGVWSGANVLHGGCSIGASRYPVVAARYAEESAWLGTAKNGVCMSDGVVDLRAQDEFVGAGTGMSCVGRHGRIARGYTRTTAMPGHSCSASVGGQCACDPAHASLSFPGDCGEGDCVAFDSIVTRGPGGPAFAPGVAAANFAVPHWKLITEGDAWQNDLASRCDRDVVPAGPFTDLCALLDADAQHDCTVTHLPDAPHCSYYNANLGELCLDWFAALP